MPRLPLVKAPPTRNSGSVVTFDVINFIFDDTLWQLI